MSKQAFPDCIIGTGVSVQGTINAPGMVRIDGEFSGDIINSASVIISKGAVVNAIIRADDLIVAGTFRGTALVRYNIRYTETADIQAECTGSNLIVEPGARIKGSFSRRSI